MSCEGNVARSDLHYAIEQANHTIENLNHVHEVDQKKIKLLLTRLRALRDVDPGSIGIIIHTLINDTEKEFNSIKY